MKDDAADVVDKVVLFLYRADSYLTNWIHTGNVVACSEVLYYVMDIISFVLFVVGLKLVQKLKDFGL